MDDVLNENVIHIDDGSKDISFKIDDVEYKIIISLDELLFPKIEVDDNFDYRLYVSSQIYNAIPCNVKPSIEKIKLQSDDFFISIFDYFLYNNTDFYLLYEASKNSEVCERYIETYCRYCMRNIPSAIESMNESFSNTITRVGELTASVLQSIDLSFIGEMTEKINSALSWYSNNANTIFSGLTAALENIGKISETLLSGISDFIREIHVPQYTEEEKNELLQSYKQWGKYGWTIPPHANFDTFDKCPSNIVQADKIALQFCNKENMQELFLQLENICVRKRDLKEAIECYDHRHYKACALILFSIIDSRVIRLQSKKDEKFGVGIGAIAKFKDVAKKRTTDEGKLFLALCYTNIFPCLFAMFEDTNKFSKKTSVINRNYLDHGMSCRIVRRKDCIKLFLLLYNLLEFIDIIK